MIKTKIIKTDKAEILCIGGLPEDARIALPDNVTCNGEKGSLIYKGKDGNPVFIPLPSCNWQPLGFLKDIAEDVAKELVEHKHLVSDCQCEMCGYDINCYRNYIEQSDESWERYPAVDRLRTAKESVHSLVAVNVKLKNKFGHCPVTTNEDFTNKWFEEQEKVFTNPYLLKKVG